MLSLEDAFFGKLDLEAEFDRIKPENVKCNAELPQ